MNKTNQHHRKLYYQRVTCYRNREQACDLARADTGDDNAQNMPPNITYCPDHSFIYPGEYEPLPGQERELSSELENSKTVIEPPIKVTELQDNYRIEMPAPGFRREDFFINTDREVLSISGMTRKPSNRKEKSSELNDFYYECIQRDIVLPPDVDSEFVTAEYANNILSICLFRTNHPIVNRPGHIIVY